MRKISFLLLSLLTGIFAAVTVYAAFPSPEYDLYVYDPQGYLSASTRSYVVNESKALRRAIGAEIVIGVIDKLPKSYEYLDDYAYDWFDEWGIGDANRDNGFLLAMLPKQGKAWLATGSGVANYLSDDALNDILDAYFWSPFDSDDYDSAVRALVGALSVELHKIYPVDSDFIEETATTTTTVVDDYSSYSDFASYTADYYEGTDDYESDYRSASRLTPGGIVAVILFAAFLFIAIIVIVCLCVVPGGSSVPVYYPDDYCGPRYRRHWYRPSTWYGPERWHHRYGGCYYPHPIHTSYGMDGMGGPPSTLRHDFPSPRYTPSSSSPSQRGNFAVGTHSSQKESSRRAETTTTTTRRIAVPSFTPSRTNSYGFGGGSSSRGSSQNSNPSTSGFGGGGSSRSGSVPSSRPSSGSSSSGSRPSSSGAGRSSSSSFSGNRGGGGGSSRGGGGGRR